MLNSDALAELSKLKQIIEDNKDSGEGIVRGSQGRYGFVNLDDGRSVYLPAEEMQRVLPGDRVLVEVVINDKKKLEAKLEKLLEKNFKIFVGTYTYKGNNHFVIPDHRETSRGLFVPPKERKSFSDGEFVQCQVSRHPFADGKSQVKILNAIGKRDDAGVEHRFIEYKHQLNDQFDDEAEELASAIKQITIESISESRTDLSHLPFVTIDAASTEDLDDALYAETEDEGWTLYSAIADPGAYVAENSCLDKSAKSRASSVYFPGRVIPMFPTHLTTNTFSLTPLQLRPALVCKMRIAPTGEITEWEFVQALIKSQAKLSYDTVATYIEAGSIDSGSIETASIDSEGSEAVDEAIDAVIQQSLQQLNAIAAARKIYRQQHSIVQDDNVDYYYRLNGQMLIESVSIRQSTSAHRIVEEAMLATNCCAGEELSRHQQDTALYSSHPGFRSERIQEIQHLLKLDKPDFDSSDIDTFAGFTRLMRELGNNEDDQQILWNLRRLLQAAEISTEAKPHFGLGFQRYALITSPIRRYQDLHNQRLIKQLLNQKPFDKSKAEPVPSKSLQEKIGSIRSAQKELIQRLLCRYLENKVGSEFDAKVVAVSSQGLALRLIDSGAESFLPLRKGPKQVVKYDSVRLSLTVNESCYNIEQVIRVKLDGVDPTKYQLQLSLL